MLASIVKLKSFTVIDDGQNLIRLGRLGKAVSGVQDIPPLVSVYQGTINGIQRSHIFTFFLMDSSPFKKTFHSKLLHKVSNDLGRFE
jgi:hypothetical protein